MNAETKELPTVVHEGVVDLAGIQVKVLHLSNGERVIDEETFHRLLEEIFGDPA